MTKIDIQNIIIFLRRVQLTGEEAVEYVRLLSILQDKLQEEENKNEKL